ncbi:CoA-binding protein [Kordia sp. YSTF-M3]|uniref:CoA-binding protein n=1 Tax=Kordia aestuariivivens TaxID=2759037 RepID=A0ABR7QFZ4_9FLAO|nr:CoA-binding protein [Kordia aestuariivivens]MBC8757505.1 CoA-binding protein [Kordia aestuariivivens]
MKTLVLGASMKVHRFSYKAVQKLAANNHEVVAYGLKEGEISGITIDTELLPYEDIHTITLYLNSSIQVDFYDYIISLQPKRVIFNPGTENPKFYKLLEEKNIAHEVACTLVLLASNQY